MFGWFRRPHHATLARVFCTRYFITIYLCILAYIIKQVASHVLFNVNMCIYAYERSEEPFTIGLYYPIITIYWMLGLGWRSVHVLPSVLSNNG